MTLYEALKHTIADEIGPVYARDFTHEKSELLSEDEKEKYELLGRIASLHTDIQNGEVSFYSSVIWNDKTKVRKQFFSEREYICLSSLSFSQLPLNLRAKVLDILWTNTEKKEYAKDAARSYKDLFIKSFSAEEWVESLGFAERALFITRQIDNTELALDIYRLVEEILNELDLQEEGFLPIRLLHILAENEASELTAYIEIAQEIIKHQSGNPAIVEQAYRFIQFCFNRKGYKKEEKKAIEL